MWITFPSCKTKGYPLNNYGIYDRKNYNIYSIPILRSIIGVYIFMYKKTQPKFVGFLFLASLLYDKGSLR